jgi:hypothetical protein
MSYDLYLFRPVRGEAPEETVERLFFSDSEEINPGSPDPEKEERKKKIARSLIELNQGLRGFQFEYQEIAKMENITKEEAEVRYRHLELNGPDDGKGIQITLFDDQATITVPYWHSGDAARGALDEINRYLELLRRQWGFSVYDPQMECILDTSKHYDEILNSYSDGVQFTKKVAAEYANEKKKPRWKFW